MKASKMTDQGFSGKSKVSMMGTCRFSLEYEDGMTHEIEIQIHFSPAITTILKLKEPRQGRNLCLNTTRPNDTHFGSWKIFKTSYA